MHALLGEAQVGARISSFGERERPRQVQYAGLEPFLPRTCRTKFNVLFGLWEQQNPHKTLQSARQLFSFRACTCILLLNPVYTVHTRIYTCWLVF